ncbi:Transducin (beta)-like 1 X-linked receptor 1, partial [Rhizopus stolonifer]
MESIQNVRGQSPNNFIVISSDEEDDEIIEIEKQQKKASPSTEPQLKKMKLHHVTDTIVISDTDQDQIENVFDTYNLSCEEIFEKQRIAFIAKLEQISQTYSINNDTNHLDIDSDLVTVKAESLSNQDIEAESEEVETIEEILTKEDEVNGLVVEVVDPYHVPESTTSSSMLLDELINSRQIPYIPDIETAMNIPNVVRINTTTQDKVEKTSCIIPKNLTTEELLNMLETYMFSLNSEPIDISEEVIVPSRIPSRRATRVQESKTKIQMADANKRETQKPYTPNKVWFNSTWEDWAQLSPGDILHVPFSKEETHLVERHVNKHMARAGKCLVDFWIYISSMLPGRTRLDCKWFWSDYTSGLSLAHTQNVMIRQYRKIPRHKNQHHLIQQRSRNGYLVRHAMKQFYWGNMKKENKISGGSGDAITVAVFKDALQGVRVASGALCDENVQYNMPGNLRLWDSATKNTNTLAGHHSVIPQPQQTIWRTVADIKVSHEGDLFFSGSHDGTTKVWKQSTGRLMSTLQFHCKPVNQLAVDYWTPGNILASCSNDGTATIWNIGESGKSGQGSICELDAPFYKDPAVECLEFGHHASKNHLFLGIYNRAVEHTGYVQAFDSTTCRPIRHFGSINGGVSAMSISSSGRYIVSGNYNRYDNLSGDKHLHLHDMRANESAKTFFTNHKDVNIVSISPCETFVSSGNADKEKGEVVIFDVRFPAKILHRLVHD